MVDYLYAGGQVLPIGTGAVGSNVATRVAGLSTTLPVLLSGTFAGVDGRASQSDGGDGLWYWDTSSVLSSDGSVVQSVSGQTIGRYRRSFVHPISALWYGADPTGVSDSTAAINAAIISAAGQRCTTVLLPAGTYNTSGTINLLSNVCLRGESIYSTVLSCSGAVPAILMDGVSSATLERLTVNAAHDGIVFSTHNGAPQYTRIEDVLVGSWGATRAGVNLICDVSNGNAIYFCKFTNLHIVSGGGGAGALAACFRVTGGGSNEVIRLIWNGGRVSGAATAFDVTQLNGCSFNDISVDNVLLTTGAVPITGVNVVSGLITTGVSHGLAPGDLVRATGAAGVTGLNDIPQQVQSTPSGTTLTLFNASIAGAYTSGGTIGKAAGRVIKGASGLVSANIFRLKIERPACDGVVQLLAGQTPNEFYFNADLSLLPSQVIDPNSPSYNRVWAGTGAGGFNNTDPGPIVQSGITLANETILARSTVKKGTPVTLANGANDNVTIGGIWNNVPAPFGCIYIYGPSAGFTINGLLSPGMADGFELDIVNTTTQTMTLAHLAAGSSGGNRLYAIGSPTVTTAKLRYVSAANANPAWDGGNGVWMLIGKI